MTIPEPSIEEMLVVAHGMGLETVGQAWDCYCRHYDVFFCIDLYQEQMQKLVDDLKAMSLTRDTGERRIGAGGYRKPVLEVTEEPIIDACNRLNIPLRPLFFDL